MNRRFHQGLQFRGAYTLGKSLDNGAAINSSVGSNAPGFVMYPTESGNRIGDFRRMMCAISALLTEL